MAPPQGAFYAMVTLPVDDADHCETPLEAYRDIAPALHTLASALHKPPSELTIYDPYFCDGAVARHLAGLGFPTVYNRREDCYRVWREQRAPPFDVSPRQPSLIACKLD